MRKKIGKLSKPTDVSETNLSIVIQSIHDKINELVVSINTGEDKAVPDSTRGKDNDIKIIDDHGDGKVKVGVKTGGQWHTVNTGLADELADEVKKLEDRIKLLEEDD
tara:strand:- start:89 stop:409 length:321 start_codon:yes stop_codon:yes gene_type:complete